MSEQIVVSFDRCAPRRAVHARRERGDSAVFALLNVSDPKKVAERFAGYGGKIIRTTMKPVNAKMVQDLIRAA